MLREKGIVTAVEEDAVWVETIQTSTCGTCVAKKGCGQRLLAGIGAGSMRIRALKDPADRTLYRVNQSVEIAIPERVVVNGSLFVYLLPLVFLVAFSGFAHHYWLSETASILSGLLGLSLGGLFVRYHAQLSKNDAQLQPILLYSSQV